MATDIQLKHLSVQALVMMLMLCVEGWFLCVEHRLATWLFHMKDISFLVYGDPSGQVLHGLLVDVGTLVFSGVAVGVWS